MSCWQFLSRWLFCTLHMRCMCCRDLQKRCLYRYSQHSLSVVHWWIYFLIDYEHSIMYIMQHLLRTVCLQRMHSLIGRCLLRLSCRKFLPKFLSSSAM